MTPLNENQLEQIRNERKQQILEAALKVFSENGIKLTKISMIAKEAGVSHGLVYHYFQSKEEVLYESLLALMGDGETLVDEINALDATPLEKIKYFTKLALTEGNIHVFRVIFHVLKSNQDIPEDTKALIEKQSMMYVELMFPLIMQGQEIGEIIKEDPEDLVSLYLSVLSGLLIEGDLQWLEKNTDRKIELLVRMIEAR